MSSAVSEVSSIHPTHHQAQQRQSSTSNRATPTASSAVASRVPSRQSAGTTNVTPQQENQHRPRTTSTTNNNSNNNNSNSDDEGFSSPSLNPSRSVSAASSIFSSSQNGAGDSSSAAAASQLLQQKQYQKAKMKTTSEWEEELPKQLVCGGTRYVLIELGEGNGGHVYIPSLALQKRPMPMQYAWRPRFDESKKAMFFVNLHDRAKLWQLPDVQEQLTSAVEHHTTTSSSAANNDVTTTTISSHQAMQDSVKNERGELLQVKKKQQLEDAIENSLSYKLINDLTAKETGQRRKIIDRQRHEYFEEYESFRDDIHAMKKIQRVQLAVIEAKLREDIEKVMKNNVSKIAIKAEHKIHAKRRIAELLSLESAERSDIRFAYDHGLMELREDEVHARLVAKSKTRETAADKFAHFERTAVEGAEEMQRSVLLQEESTLRAKMFLDFSKLRLGGFLRLMKPEPGDPKWSPWSEEIRPENTFIASKGFGLFFTPPPGEVVHKAWYAKRNASSSQNDSSSEPSELLAAARVDSVALFGDFCLGLSELFRLFVRAMLTTAAKEISEQQPGDPGRSVSQQLIATRRSVSGGGGGERPPPASSSSSSVISSRISSIHLDFDAPPQHLYSNASAKFRWLDAQRAIDGTPMTSLFPSSLDRSKERQLIDVIKTEQEWRDRSLAHTIALQQKRKEEEENAKRRKPMLDKQRDLEQRTVTNHDTAIGRHSRRFPHRSYSQEQQPSHDDNFYNHNNNYSSSRRSPSSGGNGQQNEFRKNNTAGPQRRTTVDQSLSASHFKTPHYQQTPEEILHNNSSNNHNSSKFFDPKRISAALDHSEADIAAERLELIRAIRQGAILEDKTALNSEVSPTRKIVEDKLSYILNRGKNRGAGVARLDGDADWSRFTAHAGGGGGYQQDNNSSSANDGGLKWDYKCSRGLTIAEEGSTAFFDVADTNTNSNSNNKRNNHKPFRIAPAFSIGTVGVSRGLFIWQVKVQISNYQKYAGVSPTFKVGMVSRYFAPAMEKASQRNSVLGGMIASPSSSNNKPDGVNTEKAMSYWYDEKGSLWCGADAMELTEVAKGFGPPIRSNINSNNNYDSPPGCNVTIVLDFDKMFIQFFIDGKSTGVAFRFNPNQSKSGNRSLFDSYGDPEPLFPCVLFSSVGDEATLTAPDEGVLAALSLDE